MGYIVSYKKDGGESIFESVTDTSFPIPSDFVQGGETVTLNVYSYDAGGPSEGPASDTFGEYFAFRSLHFAFPYLQRVRAFFPPHGNWTVLR